MDSPADTESRLLGNTLVQLIAPGLRMTLGIVLSAVLGRYLGVGGFGAYALVFAYVAIFNGVLADWGVGTVCLREISRHPQSRAGLLASAAALQLLVCGVTYAAMLAGLLLLHYPEQVNLAIALYGLTVFFAPIDILALPFQAELRLLRLLGPSVAGVVLSFVSSLVVVLLHGPLPALVGAALASLLVSYAWVLVLSAPHLTSERGPLTAHWKLLARESWPLGLTTVLTTASQQGPILALSLFSLESTGIFSAANRLPFQMTLLPLMLRTSSFPLLAGYWASNRARFRSLLQRLLSIVVSVAVPVALILCGLAEPLMRIVFGTQFEKAALPFQLLVVASVVLMPAILFGEALVAAGRQRVNLVIQTGAVPILGVLLLGLVPRFGASGAAGAVLGFFSLLAVAEMAAARRFLTGMVALRPLISGAAAAACGALLVGLAPLGAVGSSATGSMAAGLIFVAFLWVRPSGPRRQASLSAGITGDVATVSSGGQP